MNADYVPNLKGYVFFYCELCPSLRMSNLQGLILHYTSKQHRYENLNKLVLHPDSRRALNLPEIQIQCPTEKRVKLNLIRKCDVCQAELNPSYEVYVKHIMTYHNLQSAYRTIKDEHIHAMCKAQQILPKNCEICQLTIPPEVSDYVSHIYIKHSEYLNMNLRNHIMDNYVVSVFSREGNFTIEYYCAYCKDNIYLTGMNEAQKHLDNHLQTGQNFILEKSNQTQSRPPYETFNYTPNMNVNQANFENKLNQPGHYQKSNESNPSVSYEPEIEEMIELVKQNKFKAGSLHSQENNINPVKYVTMVQNIEQKVEKLSNEQEISSINTEIENIRKRIEDKMSNPEFKYELIEGDLNLISELECKLKRLEK